MEKYLYRCIDSIINQTLNEIEIILVNDGSPDDCGEICNQYAEKDERIKVLHQKNSGANVARNNGLKNAVGQYVAFLDGDDYIAEDMYEKLYLLAIQHEVDVVNSNHFNDTNGNVELIENNLEKNKVLEKQSILNLCKNANEDMLICFAWRNIIKKSLIEENSIYYNETLSLGQETPFMLEVLFVTSSMISTDEAFYYYVQRDDSKQGSAVKVDLLNKLSKVYIAKLEVYKKYKQEKLLPDLYRYVINHYLVMLISNIIAQKTLSFEKIEEQLMDLRESRMIDEGFKFYPEKKVKIQSLTLKTCVYLIKNKRYKLLSNLIMTRQKIYDSKVKVDKLFHTTKEIYTK